MRNITRRAVLALALVAGIIGTLATPAHAVTVKGGQSINTVTGYDCTATIPVKATGNGMWYTLTAGHCIAQGGKGPWYESGENIGSVIAANVFGPGGDFAAIKAPSPIPGSIVSNTRMTSYRDPKLSDDVCVYGARSGRSCGEVVSVGQTASYDGQTVNNLAIVRGTCLIDGDSGSPVVIPGTTTIIGIAVATSRAGSVCYGFLQSVAEPMLLWGLVLA